MTSSLHVVVTGECLHVLRDIVFFLVTCYFILSWNGGGAPPGSEGGMGLRPLAVLTVT